MIKEAAKILSEKKDLSAQQMALAMEEIMSGRSNTADIALFLKNLSLKGENVQEIASAAKVMRAHSLKVRTEEQVVLDTCGTGGDTKGTFNISTVVAFVVSGSGITVAKHGNRSVSSRSGSADVLESLGININLSPEKTEECLKKAGIAFLFAQNFHPAMKYAMEARKSIGTRTIFNLLGPLCNPASATHQLIGVYDGSRTQLMANVCSELGMKHTLVVHGKDGLDEVTITDATIISEQRLDSVKTYEIVPEDFGIKRVSLAELSGGAAFENAGILLDVLEGKPGPERDCVVLNAACALYAADKAASIEEGIEYAALSIDSGEALDRFKLLKECSNSM